jgi:hypothetical protein
MSKNFKSFYSEKLSGKEKIKRLLLTTRIDHILFIIRLNTLLTTEKGNMSFSDHLSCDLGKTLALPEIQKELSNDEDFKKLLVAHEQVHTIVKSLITKVQSQGTNKVNNEE